MNRKLIKYAFSVVLASDVLVTVLAFFGQFDWRLDLLSHFRLYYLIYFFFLLILVVILKSKIYIAITLVFLIIKLLPFLATYLPVKSPVKESGVVVLAANVSRENRDFSKTIQLVQKVNPDIIVLEEVDNGWLDALSKLKASYPHQISEPREDFFGITLLSKYPLKNQSIKIIGDPGVPIVVSDIEVNDKTITVIGIHPIPPFNQRNTALRNDQIEKLSEFINHQGTPVLVVGDMNATVFSYPYKKLMKETKLTNCSNGFGYHPTWYFRPFVPPLGLQIDHCFYNKPIVILDSYVEGDIGSDHRPIINRFSIK